MKVSWHDGVAATPPTHPLPPAHKSEQPFAGLLKDPGTSIVSSQQHGGNQRAFGFGELGIFGRFGAQPLPAPQDRREPAAGAAPSFGQEGEVPQMPAADRPPFLPSGNGKIVMAAIAPDGEPQHATAFLPSVEGSPGETCEAGQVGSYSPDDAMMPEENAATEPGLFERPSRPCPNANPRANHHVSLQFSETNGELSVVARSNDPDRSYSDMRQMIEETAAEFGKKLSDFYLNGTAQPSFTSALGGPHGSRSR